MTSDTSVWADRTVMVTGAAGLLGGRVVADLGASGARVIAVDRAWAGAPQPVEGAFAVDADVRDQEAVERTIAQERVDTVIHLAAQTLVGPALRDPVDTFEHNVAGTWHLLEACRSVGGVERIVVASSDKAYGDAGGRAYVEDMALRPRAPYDTSKAAADLIAQAYAHTYEMAVTVSRCANLYGEGDRNWSRIVPGTIRSVIEGQSPVIRSDGSPTRDYLYVGDASLGIIGLADAVGNRPALRGEPFNYSGSDHLSVREVVDLILDLMESDLEPRVLDEATHEIPAQTVSADRARQELGWRPMTDMRRGLVETIEWYRVYLGSRAP
ncbi:MAG: NAD-dependent epimerase/dehydratase family protein [Chloroflexota bacterium]